jgi:hypothetical protein
LELTDQVEAFVAEGRWSEASSAEVQRQALLIKYVEQGGRQASGVQDIYRRSQITLRKTARQRSALMSQTQDQFDNARAISAYEGHAAEARLGAPVRTVLAGNPD